MNVDESERGRVSMNQSFANALRRLRNEKGLSQQQLAKLMHVDRSTVAKWETGARVPDAVMISQLANRLGVDMLALMSGEADQADSLDVLLLDDEAIVLNGTLPVLRSAMPNATVTGFTSPSDAIAFARNNPISLAFLDIELGNMSGLDVCRQLLELQPRLNVVFLTAYSEYALHAWDTGAKGFLLKPLEEADVRRTVERLRLFSFFGGGVENP